MGEAILIAVGALGILGVSIAVVVLLLRWALTASVQKGKNE